MTPPCKGCTDRKEGCHGVCLYYKAYRERMDAAAAQRMEETLQYDTLKRGIKRMQTRRRKGGKP